ncbi:hypothetical protein AVEN_96778-1 [Araneus ventricosus]|uniref:Uncharacterized protein n=1 Tax=Araneus ventricosus TaxID=182803 RepID=A0A4Y2ILF9_ARAVE|nr:hypothetical protein AVEN_96778-1 [Araneus ventricosus]
MSLVKIITILCNNRQLLSLIVKCNFEEHYDSRLHVRQGKEWEAVEGMTNELISQICNATKLTQRMMELLWPTFYRIMLWKSKYGTSIESQFLQNFYWTDQGRLDSIRTAKHIVRNNNISIRRRFVLACSVCLDKQIYELWKEFSNDDKMYIYADNGEKIRPLLLFWAHVVERKDVDLGYFLDVAFSCAFENGLLEAIKYLFNIYATEAKNTIAVSYMLKLFDKLYHYSFLEEAEIDIGYFLFSNMSEENRVLMFYLPVLELTLLFHYSERKYFLNVLAERLQTASENDILALLYTIFFDYHFEVNKDDDCLKIFVNIWRTIPCSKKNYIAESEVGGHFLCVLIRDNFPFLLRKGAFKKMAELILSGLRPIGFHQDKWEFLHFLVKEVVKVPYFKYYKRFNLKTLKLRRKNRASWARILRLIHKIGSDNP